MTDRLSPERRSWLMSRVRNKHTSTELRVRRVAHSLGLRYRLHRHDLPGSPDLVFPKHNIALFVHGCFWHRHPGCPRTTTPKTNLHFWQSKFLKNVERDRRTAAQLAASGWRVAIIWECQTRDGELLGRCIRGIFGLAIE